MIADCATFTTVTHTVLEWAEHGNEPRPNDLMDEADRERNFPGDGRLMLWVSRCCLELALNSCPAFRTN